MLPKHPLGLWICKIFNPVHIIGYTLHGLIYFVMLRIEPKIDFRHYYFYRLIEIWPHWYSNVETLPDSLHSYLYVKISIWIAMPFLFFVSQFHIVTIPTVSGIPRGGQSTSFFRHLVYCLPLAFRIIWDSESYTGTSLLHCFPCPECLLVLALSQTVYDCIFAHNFLQWKLYLNDFSRRNGMRETAAPFLDLPGDCA